MRFQSNEREIALKTILSVVCFGLFAHGYAYTNSFFAHDSLLELAANNALQDSNALKISVGRFMQPLSFVLRGNISAPWLMGCLFLFWTSISTFFLTRLFRLSSPVWVAGLLTTQLSVTYTNSFYIHEVDMFAVAFCMAVMAVYFYDRLPYGYWLSPVFIAISCGFYQAYFSTAVLLFQCLLFRYLLEGRRFTALLRKAFSAMFVLFSGLLLYYVLYGFILEVSGVEFIETYNKMPNLFELGDLFTAENLGNNLFRVYEEVLLFFFNPITHYDIMVGAINCMLLFLFLFIMVLLNVQERFPNGAFLFLFLMSLTLPLGGNFASFLAGFSHELMIAPMICIYFFVVIAAEKLEIPIATWLVYGLLALTFWQNIIFANQLYVKLQLSYDNTLSSMTRVIYEVEHIEGYEVGETPVLFVGLISQSLVADQPIYFDHMNSLIIQDNHFSIRYYQGHWAYITNILSYPMNFSEDFGLAYSSYVSEMPSFPQQGYCQMVDDIIVIKMS